MAGELRFAAECVERGLAAFRAQSTGCLADYLVQGLDGKVRAVQVKSANLRVNGRVVCDTKKRDLSKMDAVAIYSMPHSHWFILKPEQVQYSWVNIREGNWLWQYRENWKLLEGTGTGGNTR